MKRVLTSCLVVLICLTAFITGYCKGCYSYAEDINFMSDAELEAAYQAYLQSKGGGLIGNAGARLAYTNGKMLNFLTSDANTTPYKNINEVKGLMSWQRSELESGNSSVLQLSMSQGGASVFSLYTQWLLQNHYFGNGAHINSNGMFDNGIDNSLYSGKEFIDDNGNYCLVYICDSSDNMQAKFIGTPYLYTESEIASLTSYTRTISVNGNSYTIDLYPRSYSSRNQVSANYRSESNGKTGTALLRRTDVPNLKGCVTVNYDTSTNKLYFGAYYPTDTNPYGYQYDKALGNCVEIITTDNSNVGNVNLFFFTNNNNNINVFPSIDANGTLYITPKVNVGLDGQVNYQPYTVNEGDNITNIVNYYYNDSGTRDKTITIPSDYPDGGGGGGGSTDNPSGGTPPDWSNNFPHLSPDGEGGFNFNFTLPDLNIDWNINGLTEKFPFSIPFDLIHFVQVLNAEPETPEFDWTIDLKIYQWHIDADLHEFDNLASIVRNVEFIGFCITLVMITRRMIKG